MTSQETYNEMFLTAPECQKMHRLNNQIVKLPLIFYRTFTTSQETYNEMLLTAPECQKMHSSSVRNTLINIVYKIDQNILICLHGRSSEINGFIHIVSWKLSICNCVNRFCYSWYKLLDFDIYSLTWTMQFLLCGLLGHLLIHLR